MSMLNFIMFIAIIGFIISTVLYFSSKKKNSDLYEDPEAIEDNNTDISVEPVEETVEPPVEEKPKRRGGRKKVETVESAETKPKSRSKSKK